MKVVLLYGAVLHGYLLGGHRAQTINNGTLDLICCAAHIDNGPNINRNGHLVDMEIVVFIHRHFCHFGDVSGMAEIKRKPQALSVCLFLFSVWRGSGPIFPTRFFGSQSYDVYGASGIECANFTLFGPAPLTHKFQKKFQMITLSQSSQLVNKALLNKGIGV